MATKSTPKGKTQKVCGCGRDNKKCKCPSDKVESGAEMCSSGRTTHTCSSAKRRTK